LANKRRQDPALANIFSTFQISVPQLYADANRPKAKSVGVNLQELFGTLQIYLGIALCK
jgi:multidrug efflux pump